MKNLYAYNSDGKLTHIKDVEKGTKEVFTCINCEGILIPRKGEIKKHHFAHKSDACSYESYLHKLGKRKFYDLYSNCLKTNKPFTIAYEYDEYCNTCVNIDPFNTECFVESKEKQFDLIKAFDKIEMEKSYDGFIADVLLSSKNHDRVIFIEIAVTHKCETEKINSGNKIIEIELKEDKDLNFLETLSLEIDIPNLIMYNFDYKDVKRDVYKDYTCLADFNIDVVDYQGRFHRILQKRKYLIGDKLNTIVNGPQYINVERNEYLKYKSNVELNRKLEEIHKSGIDIKSCRLCRYAGVETKFYDYEEKEDYMEIFCKIEENKIFKPETVAVSCEYFRYPKDALKR